MASKMPEKPDHQKFRVVGKRGVPGSLSYPIATGRAKYPRDLVFPDMLFARVLRSPFARAKIQRIDTSQAEALDGVKAVITWDDPELRAMPMPYPASKTPVLSNQAGREGDEVGVMVAAESEELCDEALKRIKIEWEVLPHILDPREALDPDAPVLHPEAKPSNVDLVNNWEDGNVVAGFQECDHVVEFDYAAPLTTTFHSMPLTIISKWEQDPMDSEGPILYTPPLYRDKGLAVAREAFQLPWAQVRPITLYVGASYCDSDPRRVSRLVPLLAKRTGRPVRLAYTRREVFDVAGSQVYAHVKVGFNNDGIILAAHGKTIASSGVESDIERSTTDLAAFRMTKALHIKNETTYVYTNTARGAYLRGFPASSDLLARAIHSIAEQLNQDPTEILLKNMHTPEPSVKECLEKGKAAIGWKWHPAGTRKLANGRMHGMGFRMRDSHGWGSTTAISLKLKTDGKVYMPFGSAYFGVFGQDALAMVVAEEVGARLEDVVVQMDPVAPFSFIVGGSGIGSTAYAAQQAAIDLKAKIMAAGAANLKVKPEQVDTKESTVYLKADPSKTVPFKSLVSDAVGQLGSLNSLWQGPTPTRYDGTLRKLGPVNIIFGEVEVDTEIGQVEVTQMIGVADAGKVLRPSSFEGQLEGCMVWTISKAKTEDYIFDKATGVLLNGSTLEYKPATILDIPAMQTITVETRTGGGVYGSTGAGENFWDQSVISSAVFNAIGKWIDNPITPDKVLKALGKA